MSVLDRIREPRDLRALTGAELDALAAEIRTFLIRHVSRTGGHLGPNLGVVELTLALHRVFDSPRDPIIFDTGHQSYVHKMLTGRREGFAQLRQKGGLSGYPSRAESGHDWVENSHASTSLSWAEGLARAFQLRGEKTRTVVAVIGDGALTGGMAWEALNNIAIQPDLRLTIVVNDNGRSYTPTVGGLASHLQGLRTDKRYEQALRAIKEGVRATPLVGGPVYGLMHGFKAGVKDVLAPQGLFSDLGLKYIGPVDGHHLGALEAALEAARQFEGPVIVHVITEKGKGYLPAEQHDEDRFHAVNKIDELTGAPLTTAAKRTWTKAFSEQMVHLGEGRPDVVAITAAMLHPVGLGPFAEAFPDRCFDVGIAEQHAVTFAAGLARGGFHPVVALYATFLNRAFDQVLMDVALHKLGVTFVLDRAGLTGPDGASHNGMWDHSIMGLVPGLHLAAPRDETRLIEALECAVAISDAPTVIRFSKEAVPPPLPALRRVGQVDVLADAPGARLLVVGYGQFASLAADIGRRLGDQGVPCTVVDPVWSLPVSADLVDLCRDYEHVVTVEDSLVVGGLGARLALALQDASVPTTIKNVGIPASFLDHASRDELIDSLGLSAQAIARQLVERAAAADDASTAARSGVRNHLD
ncbi:1-deoxy-D-xylulose-5-phosphate synthase [Propioniciclava tarda]|uniref:1-deoxy-D-xylulose-5-phosphate synthase n=1 Tax=Propioniciclava tarda TaxID=433330 RepID=A0A4Q9KQ29_PROTD|nr:1-deoxy-D-xylulose-5-phosphate synthase [Propioniciclava tarda]TBT95999.1 1-deoxy-D-xylulose-5-phosphate synthase [Propioniciclava tarda]SMO42736.1 1-deoxy-D-xylulose-5-phosphate synthase [Propioniciclava tarda]